VINEAWDESLLYRAIAAGWRTLGDDSRSKYWTEVAKEAENAAYETLRYPSDIPLEPGSIVGEAVRGL